MSKMSDLSLTLDELKRCGETLIRISESLHEIFSAPEVEPEPVRDDKQQYNEAAAKKEEKKPITFEEVRAVLAKKTRVSKENTAAIRKLLLKHGDGKLSGIKPEDYAALLKEAEVIPDA